MNSLFFKFSLFFHCDYGGITKGYKTVTEIAEKLLKNDNVRKSGYNVVIYIDFLRRGCYNIYRKQNTREIPHYS